MKDENIKWIKRFSPVFLGLFIVFAFIPNIDTIFETGKEVGRALAYWFWWFLEIGYFVAVNNWLYF